MIISGLSKPESSGRRDYLPASNEPYLCVVTKIRDPERKPTDTICLTVHFEEVTPAGSTERGRVTALWVEWDPQGGENGAGGVAPTFFGSGRFHAFLRGMGEPEDVRMVDTDEYVGRPVLIKVETKGKSDVPTTFIPVTNLEQQVDAEEYFKEVVQRRGA